MAEKRDFFEFFIKKICRFKNNAYLCNPLRGKRDFPHEAKFIDNTERDNEVKKKRD